MFLSELKIHNFRNIDKIDLKPDNLINYFYSPNGTGKTNLLEAIQCVSVGKSLRVKSEGEIFGFNKTHTTDPFKNTVVINGLFHDRDGIESSQTYIHELYPRKKKSLQLNKNKLPINEFIGRTPSIWFSPESIKIINSSPKNKREYFDDILIQLYPEYLYDLRSFNRALRQRNKLLQNFEQGPNAMRVWTEQLIRYGAKVIKIRHNFFQMLNEQLANIEGITRYKFHVDFVPNIKTDPIFDEDLLFRYREELRKSYDRDKRLATTTVGPHRDDWNMLITILDPHTIKQDTNFNLNSNFIRADKFASRGQQRMSLIILQLVLIQIFEKKLQKIPILLLDDIFSELDEENERILLSIIEHNTIQSFITGVEKRGYETMKEYNVQLLMKY